MVRVERSYIICTTMRSGSTMLASGLRETGVCGRPAEHFAPPVRLPQARVFDMDPLEYRRLLVEQRRAHPVAEVLSGILRDGTTPNGVFGTKIHFQRPFSDFHNAVELLQEHFGDRLAPMHELMARAFPSLRYIWLRRRDRVAQAVSLFKAVRTSEFVRVEGSTDVVGSVEEHEFDFAAVSRFAAWLQSGDDGWQAYFRRHKLEPCIVEYETLVENYEPTLRAVIDFIGVTEPAPIAATRHRRQADVISERWVERYHACARLEREQPRQPA
jgi:trehalose 2-sulfotransferase